MSQLAILEKNLEFSRKLLNYIISNNKKVHLINMSVETEEILDTLELLDEKDILLLDLSLPEINIGEISTILNKKGKHIPYIIGIISNIKQCEKLKDYQYSIIRKTDPFNKIINIINQITYEASERFYENLAKEELRKFEINITTLGYDYIVDAITLSLEDETLLKDFQNGLYKTLAEKYNLPSNYNIKWAIEKCIKSTIRYTDLEITKPYFRVETTEKITPKLFINMIVYNLKNKMEQGMECIS